MDLYCSTCGEPWEFDYVLHDAPEEFTKKPNGAIAKCPCCPTIAPKKRSKAAEVADMMADMLGDDVDGIAAMMDDMRYLGEI